MCQLKSLIKIFHLFGVFSPIDVLLVDNIRRELDVASVAIEMLGRRFDRSRAVASASGVADS